jgi:hypothetical protein
MSDLQDSSSNIPQAMPIFSSEPSNSQDTSYYNQGQVLAMSSDNLEATQSQEFDAERRASFKLGDSSDSDFDDFFPSLNKANVPEGDQSQSQPSQQVETPQDEDDDDDANLDEFFSSI